MIGLVSFFSVVLTADVAKVTNVDDTVTMDVMYHQGGSEAFGVRPDVGHTVDYFDYESSGQDYRQAIEWTLDPNKCLQFEDMLAYVHNCVDPIMPECSYLEDRCAWVPM